MPSDQRIFVLTKTVFKLLCLQVHTCDRQARYNILLHLKFCSKMGALFHSESFTSCDLVVVNRIYKAYNLCYFKVVIGKGVAE